MLETLGCEVRIWITSQYGSVICECGDGGIMSGGDTGCEKEVQEGAQYATLGDSGVYRKVFGGGCVQFYLRISFSKVGFEEKIVCVRRVVLSL